MKYIESTFVECWTKETFVCLGEEHGREFKRLEEEKKGISECCSPTVPSKVLLISVL